jgi:hypothetical protein
VAALAAQFRAQLTVVLLTTLSHLQVDGPISLTFFSVLFAEVVMASANCVAPMQAYQSIVRCLFYFIKYLFVLSTAGLYIDVFDN